MAESFEDTKTRLLAFVKEYNPDADTAPGSALGELVWKLAAQMQNPMTNLIEDFGQSKAIVDVLNAETDTYSETIDKIASNYNVERNAGQKATGKVKVKLAAARTQNFRAGLQFIQPTTNLTFETVDDYSVVLDAVDDDEIGLVSEAGSFYFVIPVVAIDVGSEYQVSDQAQFELGENVSIRDFISAEAYGSFTVGLPKETDKNLIQRFEAGLANKTLLTRNSILARLTTEVPSIRSLSIVGANDGELLRAKNNIFGLSTLGMADVYVRTTIGPEYTRVVKTAEKQSNGKWTFSIDVDEVPGYYRISSIIPYGTVQDGTLVTTQTFSYDMSSFDEANNINNAQEARFTVYQTGAVEFEYATADATGTEKEFLVTFAYQPDVKTIQDLFLSEEDKIICADYLVKSAVPCYVTINLKLYKKSANDEVPIEDIKKDIFNYVNTLEFGEPLMISRLIEICHRYTSVKYVQLPITITGDIYTQTNETIRIKSSDVLEIPTYFDKGVSDKTTIFYVDYFNSADLDLTQPSDLNESISIEVI